LYPHETVSDLIIDIREEDRENSNVEVKDVDGITIAHSTLISDLMKTPFVISIDKKEDYSVEVTPQAPADKIVGTPEIEDLIKKALFLKVKSRLFEDPHRHHTTYPDYIKLCAEYGLTEAQAVEYLRALHISGFIYNFHDNPHLKEYIFLKPEAVTQTVTSMLGVTFATRAIPELKSELEKILPQYLPLHSRKIALDQTAKNNARWFMRGGLLYLVAQSGFLGHMVWIDYSWGVMEPVTYFVFLTTLIGGLFFFYNVEGRFYLCCDGAASD